MSPIVSPIQAHTKGLIIELTIIDKGKIVDISFATTKKIIIKPPSGGKIEREANFSTDGINGKLKCSTEVEDLSLPGNYQVQAFLEGTDFSGYSSIVDFEVVDNL